MRVEKLGIFGGERRDNPKEGRGKEKKPNRGKGRIFLEKREASGKEAETGRIFFRKKKT